MLDMRGDEADRRLVRALDHVRGHFDHRPYHCGETQVGHRTEPAPPLALVFGESSSPILFFTGLRLKLWVL